MLRSSFGPLKMTTLNKLASRSGWDFEEEDEGETGGTSTSGNGTSSAKIPQCISTDESHVPGSHSAVASTPGTASYPLQRSACMKQQRNDPLTGNLTAPAAPAAPVIKCHDHRDGSQLESSDTAGDTLVPKVCQHRARRHAEGSSSSNDGSDVESSPNNNDSTSNEKVDGVTKPCPEDGDAPSLRTTYTTAPPSCCSRLHPSPVGPRLTPPAKSHPLDTLRNRGFGSGGKWGDSIVHNGSRVGRENVRGGDVVSEVAFARLKVLLRREREEVARERDDRVVAEEGARMAYAALEDECKRAADLEDRVRVLTMRVSMSSRSGGSPANSHWSANPGGSGLSCSAFGSSSKPWVKSRSLSPAGRSTANWPSTDSGAEALERHAQMTVIAEATGTAREEAQSALDAVEGFASLNRKLVEELRGAIRTRDDVLEELSRERGYREQLEVDVNELLGGGLAAALKEKEEELEARCRQEQEETVRIASSLSRMEGECRSAVERAGRERARFERVIASLKKEMDNTRLSQRRRDKEESERATMGFEEIGSIRAGFAPRSKRRGQEQRTRGTEVRIAHANGGGDHVGGVGARGGGWLEMQHGRIEAQQNTAKRFAQDVAAPNRARSPPPSHQEHHQHEKHADLGDKEHSPVKGARERGRGRANEQTRSAAKHHDPVGESKTAGCFFYDGDVGSRGNGSVGIAVRAAAVESVKAFLGDFAPRARPDLVAAADAAAAAAGGEKGIKGQGSGGVASATKKSSKWAAIGRGGKLSARVTAVCAEEASKAVEVEASARLQALINTSARSLSTSWFSLLMLAAATSVVNGGGGGGGFAGDSHLADTSADATVPSIVVRRMVQASGLLKSGASGLTLAQVDMELQRHVVGRGRLGHREFFKVLLFFVQVRFNGADKDDALRRLCKMLHSVHADVGVDRTSAPLAITDKRTGNGREVSTSLERTGPEGGLAGAERVLERDRRALEAIFLHYSAGSLAVHDASGDRGRLLPFAALTSFCKDFELSPGLISRESAHRIYVQLAYPHDPLMTPKLLAAREGSHGRGCRRVDGGYGIGGNEGGGGPVAAGLGLGLPQWMAWLGLAALGCAWFDEQRGLYNTPTKKVLGLLQWMDGSAGKKRVNATRGAPVVPAFNLLPPQNNRNKMGVVW